MGSDGAGSFLCFGSKPETMLCLRGSASEGDLEFVVAIAGGILRSKIHSDECGCDGMEGFVASIYSFGRRLILLFCECRFLFEKRLEKIDIAK